MKVFNASQIREIESKAVQFGMDEMRLMENAGAACAKVIKEDFSLTENPHKRVVILCGKGKNGGDGFVIARKLKEISVEPTIILTDGLPAIYEPAEMFDRAKTVSVRYLKWDTDSIRCADEIKNANILIDCIYGIGYHGSADEKTRQIFDAVNNSGAFVCSIDTPSGIDCAGTDYDPSHIKADLTISITAYKEVFVKPGIRDSLGEVKIVKIGIPEAFLEQIKTEYEIIDQNTVKRILPERSPDSHKGSFGHAMNICGSKRMPGAAVMSAASAVSSGLGKLTVTFPSDAYAPITSHLTEPLFLPVASDESGFFSALAIPDITEALQGKNAVLIGCGLGTSSGSKNVFKEVLKNCKAPLVIDADGINILSENIDILTQRKFPAILTPHLGEMARLTGLSVQEIAENKYEIAREFARKHSVVLVLKSHETIVTDGESLYINTTGNAGMAKGGSGDVLAGIIVSFIAQGISPTDSAIAAVYLHGLSGDICQSIYGQRGMTPTNIIEELPNALKKFE